MFEWARLARVGTRDNALYAAAYLIIISHLFHILQIFLS